jgi:hypothetical protein
MSAARTLRCTTFAAAAVGRGDGVVEASGSAGKRRKAEEDERGLSLA